MSVAKLRLPPGFYKNGTEYQSAGRWLDGDLIRWHNDDIKPIYGWQIRHDFATDSDLAPLWADGAATEAARSGIVISDNTGGVDLYIGTNKAIYQISNSNLKTDVTPAGFVAEDKHAQFDTGYGRFRYGFGQYGTPRPAPQGLPSNVFSWGFAAWGFWPIAIARGQPTQKVKIKRTADPDFVDITNSPVGGFDVVVTDERFVMVLGSPADFRRVIWSDRENFDVWTPAIDNQAGGYTLAGVGKLVRAIKCLGSTLIISQNDAFVAQYVGPPYVYGFTRVGTRCGIVGPEAVSVTDTFAAWLGPKNFWIFDGTLRQLPCDVLDFYLSDHNPQQRSKTNSFTLADFTEIWWLYQSSSAPFNEPDSYVVYNYAKKIWYTGRLDRTMGLDADPLNYPVMVSAVGKVYDHDVQGAGFEGRVPYISSGPLELENGGRLLGCSYIFPDEKLNGDVLMELAVHGMPNEPITYTRQFELTSPTSTHGIMGRDIRMKLYSAQINPNWVVGDFRVLPLKGATPVR